MEYIDGLVGEKFPKLPDEEVPSKKRKLPSTKDVPLDVRGGEIVAILPFSFGSREEVLREICRKESKSEDDDKDSSIPVQSSKTSNPKSACNGPSGNTNKDPSIPEQSSTSKTGESNEMPGSGGSSGKTSLPNRNICPKCALDSIRMMRNIVPDTDVCFGIPTCMNVNCMYLSPNLVRLPMPRLIPFEDNRQPTLKKGLNYEYPEKDEVLRSYLKYGDELKSRQLKSTALPIDKQAIAYYRDTDINVFAKVLEDVFDGQVPEIPGVDESELVHFATTSDTNGAEDSSNTET